MKIGLVLDDTLDTADGVQQYVLRVGAWLSHAGHDVHYLVGQTSRTDIANTHSLARNIKVQFNGNRMSIPLPTSRRSLRHFLERESFDILHVQMPYSPFMAGQILRAVPDSAAVIGTFHILPYSKLVTLANRGLSLLNHRSARRFDTMLAVSRPAAEFARTTYGYACDVVPNPVDLSQFEGAISSSRLTNIVFLGRLVERKGAAYVLRAVGKLAAERRLAADVRVIIGGKGPLLASLQRIAREQRIESIVTFAGFVDEAQKADFLAQADIAVYPSLGGESFGIVLLEGMAVSRGVVLAGNNPGYASVIPSEEQLMEPTDIMAFADMLDKWLIDMASRKQAAKAQKMYVKRFDVGVVGGQLEAIYKRALQTRRQS